MRDTLPALRRLVARAYDDGETAALVEMLVEETCGWTRTDYLTRRAEPLPEATRQLLLERAGRLADGEPLQYILGYADFMGLRLAVDASVLIPRPETAELVQWVVADLRSASTPSTLRMADLCTGSGCIALATARLVNNLHVLAVDLSTAALRVATANATALNISNVDFMHADVLRVGAQSFPQAYQQLDAVTCNPPYVRLCERAEMHRNVVDHEPAMALFVPDDDPLVFYRAVARLAAGLLRAGGAIYFELNSALADATAAVVGQEGYDVEVRSDAFGRRRMMRARRRESKK